MSFYAPHPFYQRRAQGPFPTPTHPGSNFHFYAAPPPPPRPPHSFATPHHLAGTNVFGHGDDHEAEERVALAHLLAIQERRQVAQIAAARDAEVRAAVRARREAALAEAIVHEQAREEAIQHHINRQIELERRRASAIKEHQERRATYVRSVDEAKREHVEKIQAIKRAKIDELRRAKVAKQKCLRSCAGQRCGNKETDEYKEINDVLGSIFGINFVPESAASNQAMKEESKVIAPAKEEKKVEDVASAEKVKVAQSSDKAQPSFPREINDLLSAFFGLHVDPATEKDKPTSASMEFNEKLNKSLNQFGVEFEADAPKSTSVAGPSTTDTSSSAPVYTFDVAAPSTADSATEAKRDDSNVTPLTKFLNEGADIPPFVRDILSNVELTFKEGNKEQPTPDFIVEGKGKCVAPGEKSTPAAAPTTSTATPAESDVTNASTVSIGKLKDISHELYLATESFTFPSQLAFATSPQSEEVPPALLFNKSNAGYHAQANKLLQLLLAADGIASGRDKDVRKLRKEVVKHVEVAIEELERRRDEIWKEVKEKRERGEESDDESSATSSYASSLVGETEHFEVKESDEKVDESTAGQVKGFEVDIAEEDEADPKPEVEKAPDVGMTEVKEPKAKTDNKENGYELL